MFFFYELNANASIASKTISYSETEKLCSSASRPSPWADANLFCVRRRLWKKSPKNVHWLSYLSTAVEDASARTLQRMTPAPTAFYNPNGTWTQVPKNYIVNLNAWLKLLKGPPTFLPWTLFCLDGCSKF